MEINGLGTKFLEANTAKFGASFEIRSNLGAAVSDLDCTPIHLTLGNIGKNLAQTAVLLQKNSKGGDLLTEAQLQLRNC